MEPIDPGIPKAGAYSPGVKSGDLIEVSGHRCVTVETIEEQTISILEKIKKILETAGSRVSDIVKTTVFLKNMQDFQRMNEIYAKFFRMNGVVDRFPARTTVEIPNLHEKPMLIQIDATAYIETKEKSWKDVVSTPALVIDYNKLKQNIERMAKFAKDNGVVLRPHVKTHKCPEIARMQLEAGANGICVAKVAEAEVFAQNGFDDILIANEIIGLDKIKRLVDLNEKAKVRVALDSHKNVIDLNEAALKGKVILEVLIDVDVGLGRTGVKKPEVALELADMIKELPGLRLVGLMGYEGHLTYLSDFGVKKQQTESCMKKLVEVRDLLNENGHDINYISAAGSGTYMIAAKCPGITEIQPGTYVFWDEHMEKCCPDLFEQALTILATVNNQSKRREFTLDAGSKSVSVADGNPSFKNFPKAKIRTMTEEHGQFKTGRGDKLRIGQKVELLPAHVCPTCNLYDEYHVLKDGEIIDKWKILARGKNY